MASSFAAAHRIWYVLYSVDEFVRLVHPIRVEVIVQVVTSFHYRGVVFQVFSQAAKVSWYFVGRHRVFTYKGLLNSRHPILRASYAVMQWFRFAFLAAFNHC